MMSKINRSFVLQNILNEFLQILQKSITNVFKKQILESCISLSNLTSNSKNITFNIELLEGQLKNINLIPGADHLHCRWS